MTNILKKIESELSPKIEELKEDLLSGNLLEAEKELQKVMKNMYNCVMGELLTEVGKSKELKAKLTEEYKSLGVSDLRLRDVRIQIFTGDWVNFKSYYARQIEADTNLGSRHLSLSYWSCLKRASLSYASLASAYSVMSSSFAVGRELLALHGTSVNTSRLRELSLAMGELGDKQGVTSILTEKESLSGKRVVIGFDGGRSRIREPNGEKNKNGREKYNTPWNEPKIMVIQVLDEKGEIERKSSIPLYMGTMKETKQAMEKLRKALVALDVSQAESIQFIADGARCIWTGIKKVFRKLQIPFSKIVFTLDYYHAVEHLRNLSKFLPYTESKQKVVFEEWKDDLWEGLANSIPRDFNKRMKKEKEEITEEMETEMNYFKKHHDHMQYKKYKRRKLLCGSGLVESAVRRIINLRFKGSSSFWLKDNLEKLIFLRCTFLPGRWSNLLNNSRLYLKKFGTI